MDNEPKVMELNDGAAEAANAQETPATPEAATTQEPPVTPEAANTSDTPAAETPAPEAAEDGKNAKGAKNAKKAAKDAPEAVTPGEAEAKIVEGRANALKKTLAEIEKQFGKGAVMRWGEKVVDNSIEVVPTGSLGLDVALGVGGVPRGRIIEIYGPEASGKTTLTLHIVAEVQKMKGIAAFIDAEHALDPVYAKKLGVNIDDLYISQPDNGEQALDIAEEMVRSGAIDLIVIDSVAALVPRSEIEGEMGASQMGLQARLMSQALRKLTAVSNKTRTIIIFTNQLRINIGGYGSPETTTGGRALKFYASVRLDIRKQGEPIKAPGDKYIGNRTRVKVAKNKLAPPFKVCYFDIMYGEGISYEGDLLEVGADQDVVNKSGAWYSFNEHRLGNGREMAKAFLKEHPEVCEEIENAVRAKNGMKSLTEIRKAPVREVVQLDPTAKKKVKKSKNDKKAARDYEEDVEQSSDDDGDDYGDE